MTSPGRYCLTGAIEGVHGRHDKEGQVRTKGCLLVLLGVLWLVAVACQTDWGFQGGGATLGYCKSQPQQFILREPWGIPEKTAIRWLRSHPDAFLLSGKKMNGAIYVLQVCNMKSDTPFTWD